MGESCLITVTVPILLTDLNPLFTLFYCFILIYAYKHTVYVLHQRMLSLQRDCLYFKPSWKEKKKKGAGKLLLHWETEMYSHAIVVV